MPVPQPEATKSLCYDLDASEQFCQVLFPSNRVDRLLYFVKVFA
jgi:hypothetical protein